MNFLYSFYFFLFFLCENTEHFSTNTQAHNMEIDLKTMTSEKDALNVELQVYAGNWVGVQVIYQTNKIVYVC